MNPDVKQCVDTRVNFFDQYYTVPQDVLPDVEAFCAETVALGEKSADATAFEAEFSSSGLAERFTSLLTRCTPKAYEMTEADKAYSKEVKKEMFQEQKGQIARDIAADIGDSVMMKAESDIISKSRETMIEQGTLDEYTRVSNAVEDVGMIGKAFGKLFKKNK